RRFVKAMNLHEVVYSSDGFKHSIEVVWLAFAIVSHIYAKILSASNLRFTIKGKRVSTEFVFGYGDHIKKEESFKKVEDTQMENDDEDIWNERNQSYYNNRRYRFDTNDEDLWK